MADTTAFDPSRASQSLYDWWFRVVPAMFGTGSGADSTPAADHGVGGADATGAAAAVPQASQALALAQQLFGTFYMRALQTMMADSSQNALAAFQKAMHAPLDRIGELLGGTGKALSTQHDLASMLSHWTRAPLTMWGDAMEPLSLNLERAYGGLADAFGLAPMRELQDASRELAEASLARRQAQAEYLAVVSGAMASGAERMTQRLAEMAGRGETVDSLLSLVRLWARSADEAMHAAMQSQKALDASARLIRAGTEARLQQQRVVSIISQALNVPTRSEVDDAYREIQELKRELRQLRKAVAPVVIETPASAANGRSAPAATRKRKPTPTRQPAAKSGARTSRKGASA